MVSFKYKYVTRREDLPAIAQEVAAAGVLAEDLETTGFSAILNEIRLWSINTGKHIYVIDAFKTGRPDVLIQAHKDNTTAVVVGSNLKFDQCFWLYHYGLELGPLFDCFRASALLWNGRDVGHNLWDLYRRELNVNPETKDLGGSDWSAPELTEDQLDYAAEDVFRLPQLRDSLKLKLLKFGLTRVASIEFQSILAEAAIELNGFYLNSKDWLELATQNSTKRDAMELLLWNELPDPDNQMTLPGLQARWNLDSNQQMLASLQRLGVTQRIRDEHTHRDRTVSIQDTSEITLAMASDSFPILSRVLEYRESATQLKMFGPEFLEFVNPVTGRLHPSYYPFLLSGRFACSKPGLSQIPRDKRFRNCFQAGEGRALCISDYSNIEMCIVAEISGDETLIKVFRDGKDAHRYTASILTGKPEDQITKSERQQAKPVGFGLIYGMKPPKLVLYARAGYGVTLSLKQSTEYCDKYFARFDGVARWHSRAQRDGQRSKTAYSLAGRLRFLDGDFYNEYYNHPVQGCLQPQTRVLTSKGYSEIGALAASGTAGIRVWTGNKWAAFSVVNRGPCAFAELKLSDGSILSCDTRHEILTVTDEGYHWKAYADLVNGDKIATSLARKMEFEAQAPLPVLSVGAKSNLAPTKPEGCDNELWFWIGFYFGDGWKDSERGALTYVIAPNQHSIVSRCISFWRKWGLNPKVLDRFNPKTGHTHFVVEIWSVDLVRWLNECGIVDSNAKEKRLPDRIFGETLANRLAFTRGFMDADGQFPDPRDGGPNLHLCQREVLQDMKNLLRTLGVESVLRGPYYYEGHESWRLDLVYRMWCQAIGVASAWPRLSGMNCPKFITEEFRAKFANEPKVYARRPPNSAYVLYNRLVKGGTTSVYSLDALLTAMSWKLDSPLYAYRTFVSKRALPIVADTFTLAVEDSLHRFDSEGVISKNTGADGLKTALRKVYNRFKKLIGRPPARIKDLPEPAVRTVHHVHDELVTEAKNDKDFLAEVEREQEAGMKEGMQPLIPRVPVKVESGTGPSWGSKS